MGFYDRFQRERLLAAHRGWRTIRPENTMAAFEASLGHFDLIELDLQLSQDGHWLVCHDESLERTTDVESRFPEGLRPRRFADYTLSQLRSLDASSWFLRRDPFGTLASGALDPKDLAGMPTQRLPTLQEVLAFSDEHSMPLNLEIKDMPMLEDQKVVRSLLAALGMHSNAPLLFSSFNHHYLAELKRLSPSLHTAALIEKVPLADPVGYLERLGAEALHIDEPIADEIPFETLQHHGITCAVFTVNDPARAEELYSKGCRALFADHPPRRKNG